MRIRVEDDRKRYKLYGDVILPFLKGEVPEGRSKAEIQRSGGGGVNGERGYIVH